MQAVTTGVRWQRSELGDSCEVVIACGGISLKFNGVRSLKEILGISLAQILIVKTQFHGEYLFLICVTEEQVSGDCRNLGSKNAQK